MKGTENVSSPLPRSDSLLAKGEICFCIARDSDRLRLALRAFMPCRYCVAAVGNVFDLERACLVGRRVIRCRRHDDVTRHLGVDVAEERHRPGIVEFERTLLTLGPGSKIVGEPLVAANGSPEDVMSDRVAVQKINHGSDLRDGQMWRKHQPFLVDQRVLGGSWKRLA